MSTRVSSLKISEYFFNFIKKKYIGPITEKYIFFKRLQALSGKLSPEICSNLQSQKQTTMIYMNFEL